MRIHHAHANVIRKRQLAGQAVQSAVGMHDKEGCIIALGFRADPNSTVHVRAHHHILCTTVPDDTHHSPRRMWPICMHGPDSAHARACTRSRLYFCTRDLFLHLLHTDWSLERRRIDATVHPNERKATAQHVTREKVIIGAARFTFN
jgi:hypothetical protein